MPSDKKDDIADSQPPERTKLAEIARQASVSLSTVSRVLNGRPGIADSTRSLVENLLRDNGYRRRDGEAPAPLIEVVCSELDSWTMELIHGIERAAREHGLSIMLTNTGDMWTVGRDWADRTVARRPTAVIIVFAALSTEEMVVLRREQIPFVVVDPATMQDPDVPSVGAANWYGGVLATQHLIELGHTRIGMISGPSRLLSSRARLSGYRTALTEADITYRADYVAVGTNHKPEAIALAKALLSLKDPPTAIFAGNDDQAVGIYEAAASRGVRIPADLSVVGFDDLEIAELMDPPLTTVRQPLNDMGQLAVDLAINFQRLKRGRTVRMDLATTLIVRASTSARN
jgi:LacI family xylobiose transport system transcriptional regulator